MNEEGTVIRSLKGLRAPQRKAISISQQELVESGPVIPGQDLPLMLQPAVEGVSLNDWALANRERIRGLVLRHGGVLFRNFKEKAVEEFEKFVRTVSDELLEYRERSSPRSQVQGNVYTSTDYPPDQEIFLHNENSYQYVWPKKIFFFCVKPSEEGGETPLADCRKVFRRIDPEVRRRFLEKGWMYVRNFGDGFGLPWQTVFQTSDRDVVEAYCRKHGIVAEWKEDNRLCTRAVRQAAILHPETGEPTWFNHATFFHISTLSPALRETLLSEFEEKDLPANSYYGDGSPIEPAALGALRQAYAQEKVKFRWQKGDLLMLDNLFVAHGREPFKGTRKVVVGMAEPGGWEDVQQVPVSA